MSTPKLLVVDDEQGLRLSLSANLELDGYDVTEASSAEEALQLFQSGSYDAVLTDMRMPGASGLELFGLLRALDPHVPVILLTGFADEGLMETAIQQGLFAVLRKPSPFEAVATAVARAAVRPVVAVVDCPTQGETPLSDALRAVGVDARDVSATCPLVLKAATDVAVVGGQLGDASELLVNSLRAPTLPLSIIVLVRSGVAIGNLGNLKTAALLPSPPQLSELVRQIARCRSSKELR